MSCTQYEVLVLFRRRLSRLEVHQVDTYSRVVGRTREEVRRSTVGRSTSEEYGRLVRGLRPRPASSHTDCGQRSPHWAYFRCVIQG